MSGREEKKMKNRQTKKCAARKVNKLELSLFHIFLVLRTEHTAAAKSQQSSSLLDSIFNEFISL